MVIQDAKMQLKKQQVVNIIFFYCFTFLDFSDYYEEYKKKKKRNLINAFVVFFLNIKLNIYCYLKKKKSIFNDQNTDACLIVINLHQDYTI